MPTEEGWLFDLYPRGALMVLWFITVGGERLRLTRPFAPSFYVAEEPDPRTPGELRALAHAAARLPGVEVRGMTRRSDFWTGAARKVIELRVTDLELAGQNLRALYRRWPGLEYFNADIAPEIEFGYATDLFPTAYCALEHDAGQLLDFKTLDAAEDTHYEQPPLRIAELTGEGITLAPRPTLRALSLTCEGRTYAWDDGNPRELLASFRACLRRLDPDVLCTRGGDALLMPALFALAEACRIDLGLDREPRIERRLVMDGRSYMSYGRVLYQAPDYPLFGRWHIDNHNSFWSTETGLAGLLEVARLSKIPVQRAARRSIGTGISSIQLNLAYRESLIPWKKSQPEGWKSAAALIRADRGGLVYQPIVGTYEDVIELDFVSMYPTIMVRENVSPETVNCACCKPLPKVPDTGYSICGRRQGMVSRALEPIIAKRIEYKRMIKAARATPGAAGAETAEQIADWEGRQGAIKWLLVCCFGYLGYRNARFGRIEAHESTCAFSREKLMQAKELCEARGFRVLHAIVDCVWIQRPGADDDEIKELCAEISHATNLDIAIEGRYRWLAFLPSRVDPEMPVPNRYFGCFEGGKLKYRGIEARRHDQAPFVQRFQLELLDRLVRAGDLAACRALRLELLDFVHESIDQIRRRSVPLEELILRRKTSMEAAQYCSNGMTAVAARQAQRAGINLHAGESVAFLVIDAKNRDADSRLRLACLLAPEETYDAEYYCEQARRAAATVLEPILNEALDANTLWPPPVKSAKPQKRTRGKPTKAHAPATCLIEQPDFLR